MIIGALLASAGCSTVLYVRKPETRTFVDATYEITRPYFLWGTTGEEAHVYADKVCLGKDVDQISIGYTGSNVLASVITLGIYMPRTVKVWCQL